jgi:phosphoribosylformylglycinamidine synthase subunit PurS
MTETAPSTWLARVRIVLKPVINDPQGRAIEGGLRSLGFADVRQVRAGKYLEIQIEAADAAEAQRQTDDMCRKLLANPIIEDYTFEVEKLAAPESVA